MRRCLLVFVLLLLPACAAERATPTTGSTGADGVPPSPATGAVVDEALLSYLSTARAHHLRADLLEAKGDVAGARAEMEALLGLRGVTGLPVLEAAQDAWARLARLELEAAPPRIAEATRAVDTGLALSPDETFYRANLLMAKGEVLEARGDVDAALDAYAQSIEVNKKVLERLSAERSR